jgi:hypothetical protein
MERVMEWNNQAREILKEMIETTGKDYIDICQLNKEYSPLLSSSFLMI